MRTSTAFFGCSRVLLISAILLSHDIVSVYQLGWGQEGTLSEFLFGFSLKGPFCPTGPGTNVGLCASCQVYPFWFYIYAFSTAGS